MEMGTVSIAYDLALALSAALLGGLASHYLRLPALIGYMLAGILVGPFVGISPTADTENIQLLAEIGVVMLMFGVGVDFSLQQLRQVQRIALFGGGAQVILTIALGVLVGYLLNWPWAWQIFFGCALALSSTTVLLKIMMERGELDTKHAQIMIGVSIVQDLSTILMVSLLPAVTLSDDNGNPMWKVFISLALTGVFLAVMLVLGTRLVPLVLARIAKTGSRELFLLATVVLSLGTAFIATSVFGLSPALGAFIAGMVVSESDLHYRVLGEVIPIRDMFGILFFVSVGMLIDPMFVVDNIGVVLIVVLTLVGGKFLVTLLAIWWFDYSRRTLLLVAAGLAQMGEFSFILAAMGMQLGVIDRYLYSLILAGALISSLITPFFLRAVNRLADWLDRHVPAKNRIAAPLPAVPPGIRDHVVICGYGRVGQHLVEALHELNMRHIVIEQDYLRAQLAREHGSTVIYGDSSMPSVLAGAYLERARVAVVTVPETSAQRLTVQQIREIAPNLPIISRARQAEDLPQLYRDGANDVVVPIFEGGMEILRQTLLRIGLSAETIQSYSDVVHSRRYEPWQQPDADSQLLSCLRRAQQGLTIEWYQLRPDSAYAGRTIGSLRIRQETGASVVALLRNMEVFVNPEASMVLQGGDRIAILGTEEQRQGFVAWLGWGELGVTVPLEMRAVPS
jgi:CPA2 family monovalent cation:H+ antiporter-2